MTPTRRRSTAITIDDDALRFAAGKDNPPPAAEEPANKSKTASKPSRSTASTRPGGAKTARRTPAAPPVAAEPVIAEPNPDALEGELFPGEPRIKIGTVLPAHLKGQVDGAVRFAQDTGDIDGVETIADFIRLACSRLVVELQREHRSGDEFDQPRINRRGRTPGR